MEISESAFRRFVVEVDDEHRDGLRTMPAAVAELHHGEGRRLRADGMSRRGLLARAGGAGAALTIGAAVLPLARLTAAYGQAPEELTDSQLAAFAESLELAAVEAYGLALAGGKITVPAVTQAFTAFAGHHRDHAGAFRAAAGADGAAKANPTILRALRDQLSSARDQNGVVRVAFELENAAASTYLFAIGALKSAATMKLAASILPVEAQHAVALGQVLGRPLAGLLPPSPDATKIGESNAFETKDQALEPGTHPVTKG